MPKNFTVKDKNILNADEQVSFVSGLKPVLELIEREPERIDQILVRKGRQSTDSDRLLDLCRSNKIRFTLATEESLSRMCPTNHQGFVARLTKSSFVELDELFILAQQSPLKLILALDQVQDTGNIGTLARTLYALGGAGIIVPKHNSGFLGPGASRASAGALERLPITKVTNLVRALENGKEQGFNTIASLQSERSINALSSQFSSKLLDSPTILVLGNEEHGVRQLVAKTCDIHVHIPMLRDFDSLNVAQAGAILIAQFVKLM